MIFKNGNIFHAYDWLNAINTELSLVDTDLKG